MQGVQEVKITLTLTLDYTIDGEAPLPSVLRRHIVDYLANRFDSSVLCMTHGDGSEDWNSDHDAYAVCIYEAEWK